MVNPELVCPDGALPALNARNFAGLNFDAAQAGEAVRYAHARGAKVLLAINTYPQPGDHARWTRAVDTAVALGIDATGADRWFDLGHSSPVAAV